MTESDRIETLAAHIRALIARVEAVERQVGVMAVERREVVVSEPTDYALDTSCPQCCLTSGRHAKWCPVDGDDASGV